MYCTSLNTHTTRTERGSKRSVKRLFALALCVLFIAATLLSTAFILTHANHKHDHDGPSGSCSTCTHMLAVGNFLKTISTAVAAIAMIFLFTIQSFLKPVSLHTGFTTLVNLKIRLNN